MKKNGVSIVSLAVAAFVGGALSYLLLDQGDASPTALVPKPSGPGQAKPECAYTIERVGGYKRVRPLLFSESLLLAEKATPPFWPGKTLLL